MSRSISGIENPEDGMGETVFDVVGIGNALVDVIAETDEAFLRSQGLTKGAMTLVDAGRAAVLYDAMPPALEMSGGSAGNTIAGVASLGGHAAYIGRVRDDELGDVFRHDIRASGVTFTALPVRAGPPTGRCLIVVTPDAQRTMNTYLGAGAELGPDDVDPALVSSGSILYLEGYLWDPPPAKQAFLKAAAIAHGAGRRVALTLSDAFCVERHRADFLDLVEHHVDLLFANEAEIKSLYQVETFDEALGRVRGHCEIAALTRSEHGSVIASGQEVLTVAAEPVARVIDTTGAGDLYAAGFMFGLTHGRDLAACARIAGIAAAEVISHYGARPEVNLAELLAARSG
jgi:sugar/nucleoside kinase (ribokinase family)